MRTINHCPPSGTRVRLFDGRCGVVLGPDDSQESLKDLVLIAIDGERSGQVVDLATRDVVEFALSVPVNFIDEVLDAPPQAQTNEATAHHEAAHFVVMYRLDPTSAVGPVSIRAHGDSLGRAASVSPFGEGDSTRGIEHEAVALFAGYYAELRYGTREDVARAGADGDFDTADELLATWSEAEREALRRRSAEMVEAHWPAIGALAAALFEHETLVDDCAEIFVEAFDAGQDAAVVLRAYIERFGLGL